MMAECVEKHRRKIELSELTECPICMSSFTDPRMLPCIYTFCFECLKRTAETEQRKPGDKMPCPICRKEFTIPADGVNGVQKNFFMENLMEFNTALQTGNATIICDMCTVVNECSPKATMRCQECKGNYCDSCAKLHQSMNETKDHEMVEIGSDKKLERKRSVRVQSCTTHVDKPLDYYCAECKKIVCVSCFVESHKLHDCKDVTTVHKEIRQKIGKKAEKIANFAEEMLLIRSKEEKKKADFLSQIGEKEKEIFKRSQDLKDMIDKHTKSILDDLSAIKSTQLKKMENQMEEIERCCTILSSFEAYCTQLRSKAPPRYICRVADQLFARADELERDHVAFIRRPQQSIKVSFQATNSGDVLQSVSSNFVGIVEAQTTPTVPVRTIANRTSTTGRQGTPSKSYVRTSTDLGDAGLTRAGWDAEKRVFDVDKLDRDISLSQLRDSETATFIYNFLTEHGGIEAIKQERQARSAGRLPPPAPPPPARGSSPAQPPGGLTLRGVARPSPPK